MLICRTSGRAAMLKAFHESIEPHPSIAAGGAARRSAALAGGGTRTSSSRCGAQRRRSRRTLPATVVFNPASRDSERVDIGLRSTPGIDCCVDAPTVTKRPTSGLFDSSVPGNAAIGRPRTSVVSDMVVFSSRFDITVDSWATIIFHSHITTGCVPSFRLHAALVNMATTSLMFTSIVAGKTDVFRLFCTAVSLATTTFRLSTKDAETGVVSWEALSCWDNDNIAGTAELFSRLTNAIRAGSLGCTFSSDIAGTRAPHRLNTHVASTTTTGSSPAGDAMCARTTASGLSVGSFGIGRSTLNRAGRQSLDLLVARVERSTSLWSVGGEDCLTRVL